MNRHARLAAHAGRAAEKLVLFLFIVSLSFLPRLMFAKTAGCPCSPCKCSPCTCGGGGGGKGGDKHHRGAKEHGGGGVRFGGTVNLEGVGKRPTEPNPWTKVPEGDSTTGRTREKTKTKNPEKEVTKTNPFDDIKVTGKEAKGDISPPGAMNVSDDNETPPTLPNHEVLTQPNPPTMDDLKKAADSFKTAEKKNLDADPKYQAALKEWKANVQGTKTKWADDAKAAEKWMKIRDDFKNGGDGKKLFDDWMEKYQALNKPGAGIPDDLVPPDKLEQAKYDLMQAQDKLEEKRKDYQSSKNTAVLTNTGVNKLQAEIDKLKNTAHFSDKDAQADRDKVKQLEKELENTKKQVVNDWASSDDAKNKMKEIQKAEKDLDNAKADFKPYEGMEKNPLKAAGNP